MPSQSINAEITRLEKTVINAGVGKLAAETANFEEKLLPEIIRDLTLITGQKPRTRPARQSIAGFKIRQGAIIGLQITLRGRRMADFIERFSQSALPRLRDFKGIDLKNIDERGNLSVGLKDQMIFPEVNPEATKVSFGLQVTIVPKSKKRAEAIALYRQLRIPLKND